MLQKKRNLAVVLSGGTARGLAHIGVLEVFDENKIPIDAIVGTSMGALVGGIYATGKLKEFKEDILKLSESRTKTLLLSLKLKRPDSDPRKVAGPFLNKYLQNKKIEDLAIDFTAVATNLKNGRAVYINNGSLLNAILASISLPGIFHPVEFKNKILIDGGVIDPLPQSYGLRIAKKVIAVNAIPKIVHNKKEKLNPVRVLFEVSNIITNNLVSIGNILVNQTFKDRSLFIQLRTEKRDPFDFYNIEELISMGRKDAKRNIKRIIRFVKEKA